MKAVKWVIGIVLLLALLLWLVPGPITSLYISIDQENLLEKISSETDGYVTVGSIEGNIWNGFTLKDIRILNNNNSEENPFLTATELNAEMSFWRLIGFNLNPVSISIDDFEITIHIYGDGTIRIPQIVDIAPEDHLESLSCGLSVVRSDDSRIRISCSNGIMRIRKMFPLSDEIALLEFDDFNGSGIYSMESGIELEELGCVYHECPVELSGSIPVDENGELSLDASIRNLDLGEVFSDFGAIFEGNEYLPSATISLDLNLAGSAEHPDIEGSLTTSGMRIGNAQIDSSLAEFTYISNLLTFTSINAEAYGGTITAEGDLRLVDSPPTWATDFTFDSIDLPRYLNANNYYTYETTGLFSGSASAMGDFASADSLWIEATVSSSGGKYVDPFCESMMNAVPGHVDYSLITENDLTEYAGLTMSLAIENREIHITEFHFDGNQLLVESSDATITFDKNINAEGTIDVPLGPARNHPRLSSFVEQLPSMAQHAELAFTVSGSIMNPKFRAAPVGIR